MCYNRAEVAMNDKEMELYHKLEKYMLIPYEDGDIDAVNAAGLSNKLMQMANRKPVLIAYWYKHDLARIKERIGAVELDTAEDFRKWNAGEIPVAVIHPASTGHGLNLQDGGSTLISFGLTWSLELYQQMNARLWRQGQ